MTVRYGGRLESMAARSTMLVMLLAQDYNVAGISLLYHLFQILLVCFVFLFIDYFSCSIYFEYFYYKCTIIYA